MPQLQPYVSNTPLQLAKNIRFLDDNNIPVTELLPVGMNGNIVNDTPKTGYISRIGAVLSDQIDRYNDVVTTLQNHTNSIAQLQNAVGALQISGTTIPNVNGYCFTNNSAQPITTVTEMLAQSLCNYKDVLGDTSALAEAILVEQPSLLNVANSYSVAGAKMQALTGWESDPKTLADSLNNLWLSYLDSRPALDKVLASITPTCSQVLIDFSAIYKLNPPNSSGFFIYFSGYSFIPSGYTDNGSTITIIDGVGGTYTAGIDIVNYSKSGSNALFVGISGTALSTGVSSYQVSLNSKVVSGSNSCSKVVIHNTANSTGGTTGSQPLTGNYTGTISGITSTLTNIVGGLSYTPTMVNVVAVNSFTAGLIQRLGYFITKTTNGATFNFGSATSQNDVGTFSIDWVAFR